MLTDFHTHILPGIDDGSKSVEQSIEMLSLLAKQGVSRVVATPHFYPQIDSPESFLARRKDAETQLRSQMQKHEGLPQLVVGAEVYYYDGISDCEFLPQLTIGEGKGVLVEMPMAHWTERMYRELSEIYEKQGLVPIVAHIDRYIQPMHARRIMQRLEQLPVCVQSNTEPFFHFATRYMMLHLLKTGQIHLLGSDCHDMDSRKPDFEQAVAVIRSHLGEDAIGYIQFFEQKLLSGENSFIWLD